MQSKRNKAAKSPLSMLKLISQESDCELREKQILRRGEAMVNPFDLKTALLAKHAQHVVLIHFPIGLFLAAVAFDLIALWTKRRGLADAAYYNLLASAISTFPVLATGLLAWQFQLEGQKLKGTLLLHLVLACVSSVLIWLVWWVHFRARRRTDFVPSYRFAVEFLAVGIVALTGHLGGFLSGVNLPS
jgi:uncharacterized membrane protein